MLRSRPPWEHAFRDKYRPRTPGGLQLQQPGKGETKSLRVPAKGSADTWCGQPGRGAATRRRGVQGRAGPRGMAHHRTDRQTLTDRQAGSCESHFPAGSQRKLLSGSFSSLFPFAFFSHLLVSSLLFFSFFSYSSFFSFSVLFFLFFCFRLAEPKRNTDCCDLGPRVMAAAATAPFIPSSPRNCWPKGTS